MTRGVGPLDEKGNSDLEEITSSYKPEEGTAGEREERGGPRAGFPGSFPGEI